MKYTNYTDAELRNAFSNADGKTFDLIRAEILRRRFEKKVKNNRK